MNREWISNNIGGLSLWALIGTLFTSIVSHFLEKNRLQSERRSQLQKEIFFETKNVLGNVISNIDYINNYISSFLKQDIEEDWKNIKTTIDTIGNIECKIKIYANKLENIFGEYQDTLKFIKEFRKWDELYYNFKKKTVINNKEDFISEDYFEKRDILIKWILDFIEDMGSNLIK